MGQKPNSGLHDPFAVDELSILNHELGNVLHGMSGMAGLLRDSGLTAQQVQWLEAIEQSSRQMHRIMESTLRYTGAEGSGPRPRAMCMDGIGLLEAVMVSHAPGAMEKGLELVLIPGSDLPPSWQSDRGLLRQLLDNLVGNAIKYTPAGNVTLRAAVSDGADLVLSVCDTGPGIERQDALFEPGRRGVSPEESIPGSGLGLFVCRRIVESMGGSLMVRPRKLSGCRFEARIPGVFGRQPDQSVTIRALHRLRCLLDLGQPLFESVANMVERVGAEWVSRDENAAQLHNVNCIIKHAAGKHGEPAEGLTVSSPENPGGGMTTIFLAPPILESGLERALFQLELEQRLATSSRSDIPD